jgi:hypothetical protein
MLKSFLSLGQKSEAFESFLIGKDKEFVEKHCGQYPVVHLDLKDCKGKNWGEMMQHFFSCVRKAVRPHTKTLSGVDLSPFQLDKAKVVPETDVIFLQDSLSWLIKTLYKVYNKKVIVLIDEYDTPLNHAFRKGFFEEASEFFGLFYTNALKGSEALEKACLMGILEVRGSGILSGLNNIAIRSVANEKFSSYFGFTEQEIRQFLGDNEEAVSEIMTLYNGYRSGPHSVVNPWSFVNAIDNNQLEPYWMKSSDGETLQSLLKPHIKMAFEEIVLILFGDEPVKVEPLSTIINYTSAAKEWTPVALLHFLVLTGYLTYSRDTGETPGRVWIPNKEVRLNWEQDILGLFKEEIGDDSFRQEIKQAFSEDKLDILAKSMRNMLMRCSFHDFLNENSYHALFLGAFLVALTDRDNKVVEVISNKESGYGRYDIHVKLLKANRAYIMEFKKSEDEESLKKDAEKALAQIFEKKYFAGLERWKCKLIGVSFKGKKMSDFAIDSPKEEDVQT